MTTHPRAPQAFRLAVQGETQKSKSKTPAIEITALPEPQLPVEAPMVEASARKRGWAWGSLLISALLGLAGLWLSLTATKLISDLFLWSLTLGWISVGLASLAGFALLMIMGREFVGLRRLRQIEHIQADAARAVNHNDQAATKRVLQHLKQLYAGRADLAWAMKNWQAHEGDIIDPAAAIRLAERNLLEPLDEVAHRIVAKRARRVTLLTTVAPTAALDMILVGAQNLTMIREIAETYGGRPSFLATLRLARMAAMHLAVTAGLALSDNFLHLFVGKGVLGRLSARFGEGTVNGILTARIGLAACEVCRPIANSEGKRETLAALIKQITGLTNSSPAP